LYGILALVLVAELAAATVPAVEHEVMAAHHLRSLPLPEWLAIQAMPKMYSYGHQVRYGESEVGPFSAPRWINHYPGRVTRMEGVRAELVTPVFVDIRTRYRHHVMTTRYRVAVEHGELVVERVGGEWR
jgi:hypothetical protein